MSRKSGMKDGKDVDNILRMLQTPDSQILQKLYTSLKTRPSTFSNSVGRLETLILTVIQAKGETCAQYTTKHPHFRSADSSSKDQLIHWCSACLSLLPTVSPIARRADRFADFQLRVMLHLCDSFSAMLEFFGYSPVGLTPVKDYLDTKIKPFPSLSTAVPKDRMPSPEYLQLILTRVDFFIYTLRHLFELGLNVDVKLHLPLIMAFFNGVLSINLPEMKRTSNQLLLRSSKLLHCLSSICRVVGVKMTPACSALHTLLAYQLDWTENWREFDASTFEGLIRHRLATLCCLRDSIACVNCFATNRLVNLLPRILHCLTNDMVFASDVHADLADPTEQLQKWTLTSSYPTDNRHMENLSNANIKRRMLIAVLELTDTIFSSTSIASSVKVVCSQSANIQGESTLREEVARFQLALLHMARQVTSNFPGGTPFKRQRWPLSHQFPSLDVTVLHRLAKTVTTLNKAVPSSCFRSVVKVLLAELTTHPEFNLRSLASSCLERVQHPMMGDCREINGTLIVPQNNECEKSVEPVYIPELNAKTHDSPPEQKQSAEMETSQVEESEMDSSIITLELPPDEPNYINPNKSSIEEDIVQGKSPKRRRIFESNDKPSDPHSSDVTPSLNEDNPNKLSIQACLSSFDPTFV